MVRMVEQAGWQVKPPHLLFVTGKLAEPSLRRMLADLAPRAGFEYSVAVLPITVAALATTPWIARHLTVPSGVDRILLPGLCQGDLGELRVMADAVERGPADLRDLPEYFSTTATSKADYGSYDIAILAEINHAPRLDRAEIVRQAQALHADGADVIDLGCDPGSTWSGVADTVRALREAGLRVSIDSFDPHEVEAAVSAGAELVLSVNRSNVSAARSWGCEVVVLPEVLATLEGLDATIEKLQAWGVKYRIDPVIEPIGLGFAASLGRYLEVRRRYHDAEMLMGVGNLTELTDVDSAGLNVLLLGFCQEIGIRSVLTTQVINWCRSCVRELDLARRLVHHACSRRVLPKHIEPNLVMLRDPKIRIHGEEVLTELAAHVTDRNFRLFAERGLLHVLNNQMYLQGSDPFALFAQMQQRADIDPSHAFYLGYEMAKAMTALTLGKNYVQDQALRWGFLTVEEKSSHGGSSENPT
jgi:dihydropteroate synthase-like protein